MFDFEIAFYLYKMSKIYGVLVESKYKAKAYYNAAMALDAYNCFVEKVYRDGKLRDIPYVGKKIEQCIMEIIETGHLVELEDLEKQFGIRNYDILMGYGISAKIIKCLFEKSIQSQECLIEQFDRIKDEFTNGEQKKIRKFIQNGKRLNGKYLYAYGDCLGKELIEYVKDIPGVNNAFYMGEMLEEFEKITHIEIAILFDGKWEYILKKIKLFPRISDISGRKHKYIYALTKFGIPVKFIIYNKDLEISGFSGLISKEDIKGDLHSHTIWSDGIHSLEQMVEEAELLGYEYHAITDHSISSYVAHGLSETQALDQIAQIREYNRHHAVKLLAGIEVDILANGDLDYCDEVLQQFDFVVAAIHSQLNQSANEMMHRLERALSNPYVNILAHPTGRLLGRPGVLFSDRSAYELSQKKVVDICCRNNVAMEINCFPERLDLNVDGVKMAVEKGVKLSLGSDAHSLAHLKNLEYGLNVLNAANIKKEDILNTYDYNELLRYFRKQRKNYKKIEKKFEINTIKTMQKDFVHFFHNNVDIMAGNKSVIGIDLTGSENKESGWAYLKGCQVICQRILSDQEIIDSVVRLNPDIVSIDSPLAYPKGRCCSKKDCECSKYGIMRECERNLRHFGLTVYPCLIDSMVDLTTRGMKLACTLRKMGYCVIESYPGVAQDILQIPRKGKTKEQFEHLKQGLISFGIKGDLFDNSDISHDEVDAVTSALVGYFYMNDQYVGLGNKEEDYLIVPRIREELLNKRVIIGISGETGAGKSMMAEYLRFKYGFEYFRYSQIIKEKYGGNGKFDLQEIGNEIAKDSKKQRELTHEILKKMKEGRSYVIDGLRHIEDYEELKKNFGDEFVFVFIETNYSNRYKRYNKLFFGEISKEQFNDINNHSSEMDITMLKFYRDYVIDNNKGFKDYREQIDYIMKKELGGNH